jgi:WD40 repeat protein
MEPRHKPLKAAPETGTEEVKWRYSAFISYRHSDNRLQDREWASWLHEQLETFEIPREIRKTRNLRGETIPETLYPVFRDEQSLPADANLASSIETALRHSGVLVVLCSPRAVESKYVAQEIERFRQLGRGECIISAIIDGEPNASRDHEKRRVGLQECFPAPLMNASPATGPFPTELEPLAADFRFDGKEGYIRPQRLGEVLVEGGLDKDAAREVVKKYADQLELAKLKIIAGILGVPLEELTKRDLKRRLHQARRNAKISLAVAVAVLTASGISVWQWSVAESQRSLSEQRRVLAERRAVQTSVLLDGANARSRLSTDAREAGEELLRVVKDAKIAFGKIPVPIQNAVAEAWAKDREIRRVQLPGRHPAIHFQQNSHLVFVEIPGEPGMETPSVPKSSTYWQFDVKHGTLKQIEAPATGESRLYADGDPSVTRWVPESHKTNFAAKMGDIEVKWDQDQSGRILTILGPERTSHFNISYSGGINCWLLLRGERNLIATGSGMIGDVEAFGPIDCSVQLWSTEGKHWATLTGHDNAVWDLAANEQAGILASVDEDGLLIVWDIANVGSPFQIGEPETAIGAGKYAIALRHDGRFLADAGYFGWKIYDLSSLANLSTKPSGQYSLFDKAQAGSQNGDTFPPRSSGLVSFPGDAGFAAIIENRVVVLDWGGKAKATSPSQSQNISSLVVNKDGTLLAWLNGGEIWIWRDPLKDGAPLCLERPYSIKAIAIRKDHRVLAVTSDNEVLIINPHSPAYPVGLGSLGRANSTLALGDRGEFLVTISQAESGGHVNAGASLRFWSEDGNRLVSGPIIKMAMGISGANVFTDPGVVVIGLTDGAVQIWDATQGASLQRLVKVHDAGAHAFAMSPDGDILYSTGRDGMIVIHKRISFASQHGDLVARKEVKTIKYNDRERAPDSAVPYIRFWGREKFKTLGPDPNATNGNTDFGSDLVKPPADKQTTGNLPLGTAIDERKKNTIIQTQQTHSQSRQTGASEAAQFSEPDINGNRKFPKLVDQVQPASEKVKFSSYWNHNGSVMGLVANGKNRSMVYVKVRQELSHLVEPGTWLFKGFADDGEYRGRARRFSPGMSPLEYAVEGPVVEEGNRVILTGKVAMRRPDGTKEIVTDRLEFRFLRTGP